LEQFKDFEIHKKILYKVSMIYKLYRLCLPTYLGRDIISKLHYASEAHLTLANLVSIFNQKNYSPNVDKIAKQTIQSCIICKLNKNVYRKQTLGENRQEKDNLEVGGIWTVDVAYLPRSRTGYKYLLVFCERLTSYLAGICLKNISCQTVSQALKIFLGIIPAVINMGLNILIKSRGKARARAHVNLELSCLSRGLIEYVQQIPRDEEYGLS
jgi:hypothetical protein